MSNKPKPGQEFIYRGIMEARRGQLVRVAASTGVHGFACVMFADGLELGVLPASLETIQEVAQAA